MQGCHYFFGGGGVNTMEEPPPPYLNCIKWLDTNDSALYQAPSSNIAQQT